MQSIDIHLKPSMVANFLNLFLWFGSVVAVLSLHIASWMTVCLLLVVFLYGVSVFFTHSLLMGPKALRGLRCMSGKHWQVLMNQGESVAILMGDSTVTLKFCVLRFQLPGQRFKYSRLIVYDSLEFDTYRRLLLRLRCFKSTNTSQ